MAKMKNKKPCLKCLELQSTIDSQEEFFRQAQTNLNEKEAEIQVFKDEAKKSANKRSSLWAILVISLPTGIMESAIVTMHEGPSIKLFLTAILCAVWSTISLALING